MFANKTRVLLILPQDVLDRARAFAGRATITLKLSVSLQIVLRALIEEGLKWDDNPSLLANVDRQAQAVRHIRKVARQGARAAMETPAAGQVSGRKPANPGERSLRRK